MWFCYWQPAMGSSVFIHKMWVAYLTKLVFTRVRKVMKATLYYSSKWGFWYCKTSSYVNPFYFVHLFFQVNHSVNKSYGKASYHFRLLLHILCKRCFPIKRNGAPKECGSNTELKMNSVPPVVIGLFFLETLKLTVSSSGFWNTPMVFSSGRSSKKSLALTHVSFRKRLQSFLAIADNFC